ncbi:MAG: EamA family transporter [Deinococcales bacterium]|nr:EamA family transporter [Chitinophagaceae bacterium]
MRSTLIKLHTAVFLWGFTGVLGRLITLNAPLLVWYRILITIITLTVILWIKGQLQKLPLKRMLQLFGVGVIVALHWVCFYGSIKYANVSIALVCLSSAGLFTALLEPIFSKKKFNIKEFLLGFIGIAGIYLIFHFDPHYKTGIIIGLFATIFSVIFTIFNKKVVTSIEPKTMMLYELSGGLISLTILMPFYLKAFPTLHLLPSITDWFWLILMSWFCTVLAMDLSLQALKKVSAFTQNLTLNLEPVYGIILAFVVYHENKELGTGFYFGFGLIILSVALQMLRILKYKHVY